MATKVQKVQKTKADNGGNNSSFLKAIGGDLYKPEAIDRKKEFVFDIMRTQFVSLNRASGAGGILTGGIWEIYGLNHSGKTALAIGILASAQEQGHLTMFGDAERGDNDERWTHALGWYKDKGIYFRPSSFENCRANVNKTINRFRAGQKAGTIPKDKKLFILIDSVATLVPKDCLKDDESEDNTARFGKVAQLMSDWLPVLLTKVGDDDDRTSNVTVMFINQMRANMNAGMYDSKYKTYGGESLPFFAQVRIEVKKLSDTKKKISGVDKKVGKEHLAKFIKCKVGVGEEAKFYTSNGKGDCPLGFDKIKEVATEAKFRKIFTLGGAKITCKLLDKSWENEKAMRRYFIQNDDDFKKLIKYMNDNITTIELEGDDSDE
jgi:RecA/RadA recombinase